MKTLVMTLITGVLTVLLDACATPAGEIPAHGVSDNQYGNYDCNQIGNEAERLANRANELAAQVEKKVSHDSTVTAVGVILFWPALFFIDGDGPEALEYGKIKGEYEALKKVSIRKECDIEFREIVPPEPAQNLKTNEQRPF